MYILTAAEGGGLVYRGRYNRNLISIIKQLPGRSYNPETKEWFLPAEPEVVETLENNGVEITAEARELVRQKVEAQEMIAQAKDQARPEPAKPMPLKGHIEPFAHQIKGYNISLMHSAAGLLHEQGCGKTITAIATAGRRYLDGEVKKLLIVAPLSVIPVWKAEFEEAADFNFVAVTLQGDKAKRQQALVDLQEVDGALQVALVNYEGYWRPGIFEMLLGWNPDMVIADESQRIKNHTAKQSKGLHKISDKAGFRMILTGTPVTATPLDFFSQYKFLDPEVFGKSYYSFRNRYAIMGGYENREVVGYRNKDELVRKAHSIAHRVTKEEALDLPEWIDQDLYCDLEPKARRYYNDMLKTNMAEIENEKQQRGRLVASNVLTRLLRLQQMVGGFVPRDQDEDQEFNAESAEMMQVSSAKLDLLKETLGDLLHAGHEVVIFARFVPEIKAIMKLLDETKFNGLGRAGYRYIYGAVKQEDRGAMVDQFQNDPEIRVFIAQVQTAGLGITLHAADTAIFYSADFNYGNYDQCKARVHRIGQRRPVNYLHLIAKDTVDEKIYRAIKQKRSLADDVVNNWKQYFAK